MDHINNSLQKEKIKKYQQRRNKEISGKELYKWLKDNKICVACKCNFARKNKTRCAACAYTEKIYQESLRNYIKKR